MCHKAETKPNRKEDTVGLWLTCWIAKFLIACSNPNCIITFTFRLMPVRKRGTTL